MNRRLHLGRIFGVEILVDWSWILTLVLATGVLVTANRTLMYDLSFLTVTLASLLAAAGLFASLGAHELVRVAAARGAGLPVKRLTLFVLGGVTDVERSPATPRTEVMGAIAAPFASFVLAVVIGISVGIATTPLPSGRDDLYRLGAPGIVLLEIGAANLAIAALNLLPAFPLDGGRLLRALIWRSNGDVERATKISAWTGQVVGWTLVLVGLAVAIGVTPIGLGVSVLGWFIASAAAQGYEGFRRQRSISTAG